MPSARMPENCEQCGHPFDPHRLVASNTGDPIDGGHIECPVDGCTCYSTWSIAPHQIDQVREIASKLKSS